MPAPPSSSLIGPPRVASSGSPSPEVTSLLGRAQGGDRGATDELFPLVYEELRRLADRFLSGESANETMQPTALVHEAYLRLVGPTASSWENRAHFFGAAARAIRRILIDRARARRRLRRGEGRRPVPLEDLDVAGVDVPRLDLLALDEALVSLASVDPQKSRVVELRFFGGLSEEETAEALGLSASTVTREWRFARIWLHRELCGDEAR
jgi:RNA polymerase sigma-70 factor (ECF subfamily)